LIGRLTVAVTCLLAFPAPVRAQKGTATNFTIRDLGGKHLRLSDFKKNVVLMYFWATWCKGCTGELRHLEKLYRKYKAKGFVVLAISMDGPESQAGVKPVVQRDSLTFPVAIDRETTVVKLYNPKHAAPFFVMLRRGKVVRTREGFQVVDRPLIEKEIVELLR
jgi:peroxiredoxin